MRRRYSNDEGFTFPELMIAATIGLIVLGIAYYVSDGVRAGFARAETGARENRAASQSFHEMTRYMREISSINHAEDNLFDFNADYDNDGHTDRLVYRLDAQDRLVQQIYNRNTGALVSTRFVATHTLNRTEGEPLFRYWKAIGTPALGNVAYTPPKDGERLTKTTIITIYLSVKVDTGPSHDPYVLRTDVFLRNRMY